MSGAGNLISLLSLLRSSPRDLFDRDAMLLDVRLEALPPAGADALARLDAASGLRGRRLWSRPAAMKE